MKSKQFSAEASFDSLTSLCKCTFKPLCGCTSWVSLDTQGCISLQKEILNSVSLSNGKTVGVRASSFLLHSGTEIIQMEEQWSQGVERLMKESLMTWTLRVK